MSLTDQMDCEDSINVYLISKTFCICCLEGTGPYIKLGACSHREYLDSFIIPVSRSIPETVCYSCHEQLKKITRFRLQVQQSFYFLSNKVECLETYKSNKRNLTISKTFYLNTPELREHVEEEPENKPDKVKKMKNIETALDILNRNTSSLQSLTSFQNFIGLTHSLLEVTSNNLNSSLISTPVPSESSIKKKSPSHYVAPVLPDEIKQDPVTEIVSEPIVNPAVNIDINSKENGIKKEQENEIDVFEEKLESMSHYHEDYNEYSNTIKGPNSSLISTPVPSESSIKKKSPSHYVEPVLPDEIKQDPVTDILSDPIVSPAVDIDINSKENRIKKEQENEIDIFEEKIESMSHIHEDCNTIKDPNSSLISTPVPSESSIKKKSSSHYVAPVLPDEIIQETEIVSEPIVSSAFNIDINSKENRIKKEQENEIDIFEEKLESMSHNHEDNNEDSNTIKDPSCSSVVFPEYTCKNPEIQNVSDKKNLSINNEDIENNDSKTTVFPTEIHMEFVDVVAYGKIMLPEGMKDDPDNMDGSLTTIENCLGEIRQKECDTSSSKSSSIVNDGACKSKRRSSSICLIPIKLNRKELKAERQEKLNSSEFRKMEFKCRYCITGFQFKENLDDHIKRKHVGRDPKTHVSCDVCHQEVPCREVREHKLRHYNRIECKKCKKRFILFDEAYDHYISVHSPLSNITKYQLQSYLKSKKTKKR